MSTENTKEIDEFREAVQHLGNIVADVMDAAMEESVTNMIRTLHPDTQIPKGVVGSVVGMAAMEVGRRRADKAKRDMLETMSLDQLEARLAELTGMDTDEVHMSLERTNGRAQ